MDAARDDQDLRLKFNAGRFASICFGVFAICHAFQYEAEAVSVRSRNFIVHGPDQNVIHSVAQKAEDLRHKIAMAWLGKPLPAWPKPCPIQLKLTGGEAGGVTSFSFDQGRVTDQEMNLEGSAERILNSALPHEITHTVFAWHFGAPMPRWADEGACMLSEDHRELARQDEIINGLIDRKGHMPLGALFVISGLEEASSGMIEIGGRDRFLKFVGDGTKIGWDTATRRHYNLPDSKELDRAWRSWHRVVASRRTPGQLHPESTLAAHKPQQSANSGETGKDRSVIRAQSDDSPVRR